MRLQRPKFIDYTSWLLRMGVKGSGDKALLERMEEEEKKLLAVAVPQGIYRILEMDQIELAGAAIKKHLAGCYEMAVMGATLGAVVDRLIRENQIRDMASAVILDCGASVLIEQVCNDFEEQIRGQVKGFLTGRYSPGYGDLPMDTQDQLIRILDAPRKIGLTVNQNHIMIPRKSVTAILGVADHPVRGYLATCQECTLRDTCVLRKEGKNCAGI